MDISNLKMILSEYAERFTELNDESGSDEGYKWRAVKCFQDNWDVNADDFPKMFSAAMKKTENLVNNTSVQPLAGIQALLKFKEEIPTVRNCFELLFSEDNGDINTRQERINLFTEKINERIESYFPGSYRYPQSFANALFYLSLWRPDENYIYRYTEASRWADCIEFGDDFGSGSSFSLSTYYRMCDELLSWLAKYPNVIALNRSRKQKELPNYDDKRHLLVWDIIYCNSTYNLYSKATIHKGSAQSRIKRAERRERYEKLVDLADAKRREIDSLTVTEMPDLVGAAVYHKLYKAGTVIDKNGSTITISFNAGEKKFILPDCVTGGFIKFEDDAINETIFQIGTEAKMKSDAEKELVALQRKKSTI